MTEQKTLTYAEILELLKATIQEGEVRSEAMRKYFEEIKKYYTGISPKNPEVEKCYAEIKDRIRDINKHFGEVPKQVSEAKKLLTALDQHNLALEKCYNKIENQYAKMRQFSVSSQTLNEEVNSLDDGSDRNLLEVLTSRFGKFIEQEMDPKKFKTAFVKLGYDIHKVSKIVTFGNQKAGIPEGEIDVLLEGKDVILIEIKQNLKPAHVTEHIKRLEKYQRYAEIHGDHRQVFGAMCGLDISPGVEKATKEKGLFLIHLEGKAIKMLTNDKEFTPTAWKHDSATESN